ncbi:hypothetical protein [Mesorhizobium sp. M0243]
MNIHDAAQHAWFMEFLRFFEPAVEAACLTKRRSSAGGKNGGL